MTSIRNDRPLGRLRRALFVGAVASGAAFFSPLSAKDVAARAANPIVTKVASADQWSDATIAKFAEACLTRKGAVLSFDEAAWDKLNMRYAAQAVETDDRMNGTTQHGEILVRVPIRMQSHTTWSMGGECLFYERANGISTISQRQGWACGNALNDAMPFLATDDNWPCRSRG